MELSKQTKLAKQTHTDAQTNGQTCIDCHKGIVHFLPEVHGGQNAQNLLLYKAVLSLMAQRFCH